MAGGNSLEGREQKKGIAVNTLYTMGGLLFMNAVLQIVITPLLNRMMGAEQLGGLLYITGLVAIICPSIGQALNNSRLVVRRDFDVTNGDYDWLLLGFGLIGSIVALFMSGKSLESPLMAAGVFLMFMLTVFRYYGDVEYRLNLNYRRYFIYYLLIGIGYLAGFGIYCLTGQWVWIYLIGEAAALAFVGVTGNIFHQFFRRSVFFPFIHARNSPRFIPIRKPFSSMQEIKFIFTRLILSPSQSTVNGVPVEPLVLSL